MVMMMMMSMTMMMMIIAANIYLGSMQAEYFSEFFTCINLFTQGRC